jgi:CheY-like chemotaxis protein
MKRILVVDDDVAAANAVARALQGYRVSVVHNGTDALAMATQCGSCALVITDYLMPTMAGDELVGRLRERLPAIRAVLLTGYGASIHLESGAVDAQIEKPFRLGVLRRTVETLIGAA